MNWEQLQQYLVKHKEDEFRPLPDVIIKVQRLWNEYAMFRVVRVVVHPANEIHHNPIAMFYDKKDDVGAQFTLYNNKDIRPIKIYKCIVEEGKK